MKWTDWLVWFFEFNNDRLEKCTKGREEVHLILEKQHKTEKSQIEQLKNILPILDNHKKLRILEFLSKRTQREAFPHTHVHMQTHAFTRGCTHTHSYTYEYLDIWTASQNLWFVKDLNLLLVFVSLAGLWLKIHFAECL